jgi:hypothetical protein
MMRSSEKRKPHPPTFGRSPLPVPGRDAGRFTAQAEDRVGVRCARNWTENDRQTPIPPRCGEGRPREAWWVASCCAIFISLTLLLSTSPAWAQGDPAGNCPAELASLDPSFEETQQRVESAWESNDDGEKCAAIRHHIDVMRAAGDIFDCARNWTEIDRRTPIPPRYGEGGPREAWWVGSSFEQASAS